MRGILLSLILVFCAGLILQSKCQSPVDSVAKVMNAVRIDKSININGKMDNPEWMKAEPVELRYEVNPADNTPAKQNTIVRVLYDKNFIYFGFQCLDTNPELIRANISDRDKMFQDDCVFIGLDTFGDYQRSYEFTVNPYGIQGDLLATSNGEDDSMDWIWYSAADKNANGWTAEFKIPFSSLSFADTKDQVWRLNLVRIIPRDSRYQNSWVPISKNISGVMPQAGYLTGISNIKPGSSFEFLPYAMSQKSGQLNDNDNPNSGFKYNNIQGRIGGGIKYTLSPDFTFDAVINPDFSQIESDAAQISVNTTFALSYSEKRPFFLIGRDLLQSQMFYSRSINDPAAAARIIGKSGGLSFLFMSSYDRHTVIDVPGDEGSDIVETYMKSAVNIGRLRYDIGDEAYIGGLLMTRDLSGGHNYLIGVDWNYKFWKNWFINGEGDFSFTKELNDTSLISSTREFGKTGHDAAFNGENYNGNGIHINLYHTEKNYNFNINAYHYSPTFQSYNGIFDRVGYTQFTMSHEYNYYPTKSFIDNGGAGLYTSVRYDFNGVQKDQYMHPYLYINLKGQMNIYMNYSVVNDEIYKNVWFRGNNQYYFSFSAKPSNEISINTNFTIGKFLYRSDNPATGKGHYVYLDILLKPTSQFSVEFSYSRARLSGVYTDELFYDGNIYRGTAIYQFNSEIFFRTILQYDTFSGNFQAYPLFSYKLNAFTTFFAGATANYFNFEGNSGVINTSQQYFLKVQYLL